MKTSFKIFAALLLTLCIAFAGSTTITQSKDLKINSTNNTVGVTVQKTGTNTANFAEYYAGSNLKYAIPSTGIIPIKYGGTGSNTVAGSQITLGIQSGLCVSSSDGTVTNSFGTAFASPPVVICTPFSTATVTTNIVTKVTTTNFIWKCGATTITNQWEAIGSY